MFGKKRKSNSADVVPAIAFDSALLEAHRAEWIAISRRTEPADREAADAAVRSMYLGAGLGRPRIRWFDSPCAAILELSQVDIQKASVRPKLFDELVGAASSAITKYHSNLPTNFPVDGRSALEEVLRKKPIADDRQVVRATIHQAVGRAMTLAAPIACEVVDRLDAAGIVMESLATQRIQAAFLGPHDVADLSLASFYALHLPECRALDHAATLARSAGIAWLLQDEVLLSERPCRIELDVDGKPHSASTTAIEYRDGFSVCAFHGERVPHDAVHCPSKLTWDFVETQEDQPLKDALADLKALHESGGDERSEIFRAAMSAKRLGGISALRDFFAEA